MRTVSLWRGLSSRLFLFCILLLSLGLFYVAELLGEERHRTLYGTLSHLAAMLLAAFIATAFFSFRDARELLSASIASLLIDGEIAQHLAPDLRRRLRRSLLLHDLNDKIQFLEPEVLEHVEAIADDSLLLPHHHSYSATVTLAELQADTKSLRRHARTSYKVSCRHCKDEKAAYRLVVNAEIKKLPAGPSAEDFLKAFRVTAGSSTFGIEDAVVTTKRSAGLDIVHVALDREVLVVREMEVSYEYETICSKSDPTEIRTVRYPTSGFRFTLVYRDDMDYDVAWFRARARYPRGAEPVGRETVELNPKGIAAYTHKWLLPGDGVVLSWFPKEPTPES